MAFTVPSKAGRLDEIHSFIMNPSKLSILLVLPLVLISAAQAAPGDRDALVRDDQSSFAGNEDWIYNDLDKAEEEAKASGKPLFVVLRCIP